MFKEYDLDALILDCTLDDHFITFLEMHENGVKFKRIDSDISDTLGSKTDENDEVQKNINKEIEDVFKNTLGDKVSKISVEGLKNEKTSAMILISEESRRMAEMSKMYAQAGMGAMGMFKEDDVKFICEHILDLAKIANKELDADEMDEFIKRNNELLNRVICL